MIFLDYLYELPNATSGMDKIFIQTATAVPGFIPLLLLFVFFVVFLGGVNRQKARTGTSDYAMWGVVASISTLLVTLIMSVVEGLIRLDWLVIVIVITIFFGVWLFLDRRQSEV
ncbi:MAG: hypothetical protein ACTSYG_10805 [Candidatus Heimdallarchaeota archaeon]